MHPMPARVLPLVLLASLLLLPQQVMPTGNRTATTPTTVNATALKPADVVNLNGYATATGWGALYVVYDVPPDRWLLLTDVEFAAGTGGLLALTEVAGASLTHKRLSFLTPMSPYHSRTGLAFQPGSQVAFRNISGGSAPADGSYELTGYLVSP